MPNKKELNEKVIFYMKSGNMIVEYFTNFTCDKLTGTKQREAKWDDVQSAGFSIDLKQVEAISINAR